MLRAPPLTAIFPVTVSEVLAPRLTAALVPVLAIVRLEPVRLVDVGLLEPAESPIDMLEAPLMLRRPFFASSELPKSMPIVPLAPVVVLLIATVEVDVTPVPLKVIWLEPFIAAAPPTALIVVPVFETIAPAAVKVIPALFDWIVLP